MRASSVAFALLFAVGCGSSVDGGWYGPVALTMDCDGPAEEVVQALEGLANESFDMGLVVASQGKDATVRLDVCSELRGDVDGLDIVLSSQVCGDRFYDVVRLAFLVKGGKISVSDKGDASIDLALEGEGKYEGAKYVCKGKLSGELPGNKD